MTLAATPIIKTFLFVPGHQPTRFDKACASKADAVIIDLEDAVSPDDKDSARQAIAAWLPGERPVMLRINSVDTPWFADDLALCQLPGISGVVLPKAELASDLDRIAATLGPDVPLFPLIETAKGMWHAHELAHAKSVCRLMFGSIDFQFDLGIDGEGDELLYFRSQLVLVSRLAGLQAPVDGVTTALDDPEQLSADVSYARRLGFGGKLCIHPKQIDLVNRGFLPSDADVQWAHRIVLAMQAANGAAVAVDGKMVDKPVLLRAETILNSAATV
ncbi:MAG: CoA ester lyase [Burkholderiaceae bacterium]|nr:CoA ester lyase [Burkholderiaceae bacterium]